MTEQRPYLWAIWGALIGFLVGGIVMIAATRHLDGAAWVQAIGSILAIVFSVGVAIWQNRQARTQDRTRAADETLQAQRRIARMLEAELRGLGRRASKIDVVKVYRNMAAALRSGIWDSRIVAVFDARQSYTVVFDTAGERMGYLPSYLASEVVDVYVDIKGMIDTLNNHSRFIPDMIANSRGDRKARDELAVELDESADFFVSVVTRGMELADQLAVFASAASPEVQETISHSGPRAP